MRTKWHWLLLLVVVGALALAAGCGGDDDDEAGGTGAETTAEGPEGGTLVFAGAADPVMLDGALVSDGESLRVITQIFETLVALKPGTTEPEPGLAESWEPNEDGTVWDFKIREDVTFHDGEPLNAEAVCFNFDRWYNFKGALANPAASYYWQVVFGGFAEFDPDSGAPEESLYESCEATDEHDCGDHADEAVGDVHPGALAAVVLDRQPEGAAGRQRRPGLARRRGRVQLHGHVRHGESDRHGPVQVRVVGAERPAHARAERGLLGREGEARQADHPADRRQRRPPAGAAVG